MSRKPSKPKVKFNQRTKDREKVAVWFDNEQLSTLREWRDTEALNIAAFIRQAVTEAIKRKQAQTTGQPR